jgi:hypothetical protein
MAPPPALHFSIPVAGAHPPAAPETLLRPQIRAGRPRASLFEEGVAWRGVSRAVCTCLSICLSVLLANAMMIHFFIFRLEFLNPGGSSPG